MATADVPPSNRERCFSPEQSTFWIHSFVALVLLHCACERRCFCKPTESFDPDLMGLLYSPEIAGQPGRTLLGYFSFGPSFNALNICR